MKKIIAIIIVVAMLGSSPLFYFLSQSKNTTTPTNASRATKTVDYSDDLMKYITKGGPPKDGIPPIDMPIYVTVTDSNYLNDYDKVFVYEAKDHSYLYPQRILVWHEIVNDYIDGKQLSITYCPLTGSAICYLGDSDHPDNTYGTSGSLLNSNLVMYDRITDSYIPQILGKGINGDLDQIVLPTEPILWADWKDAKRLYPNAKVLSQETGFFRDYNNDPYGSYLPDDERSYYYFGGPIFPVLYSDDTFSEKKIVVGVKSDNHVVALDPFLIKEVKLLQFDLDTTKAVAIYDERLKAVRVFSTELNGTLYDFKPSINGFVDQFGQNWDYNGVYEELQLMPLTYFDVMWFAWFAYYPDTDVIK
ncbi:MAG: DUF3179 domain-containing protein [Clostridiales bacterium]|nr:DUF3179 domain-containing protein [Clostridiales bacterium]